jgi:hypothetical protein
MKKVQKFEFHIDSIGDYNWFFYTSEEDGEVISVLEDLDGAAQHFGVSKELIEEINSSFQYAVTEIISNFKQDLIDLYESIGND